jgi:hypothetical protein
MFRGWTLDENETLLHHLSLYGPQWELIAEHLPGRSPGAVREHWQRCLDPKLMKGPFSLEEDQLILDHVKKNGAQNWSKLMEVIPHRNPKQVRERWCNHLNPEISHCSWTAEEDLHILKYYNKYGAKWSKIAQFMPSRSDNSIKNRWNTSISRRISINKSGTQTLKPDEHRPYRLQNRLGPIKHPNFIERVSQVEFAHLPKFNSLIQNQTQTAQSGSTVETNPGTFPNNLPPTQIESSVTDDPEWSFTHTELWQDDFDE